MKNGLGERGDAADGSAAADPPKNFAPLDWFPDLTEKFPVTSI